jgi:hypothetical protein
MNWHCPKRKSEEGPLSWSGKVHWLGLLEQVWDQAALRQSQLTEYGDTHRSPSLQQVQGSMLASHITLIKLTRIVGAALWRKRHSLQQGAALNSTMRSSGAASK